MPGLDLTEAAIRKNASVDSFQDGQQSYQQGRVRELVQRGNVLQAAVDCGMPEPYVVSATFEADGGAVATCTCRYDRSGWCKHIVATLLAARHSPQAIVKRPPLRDLLAGVDRDGLQTLLQQLVDCASRPWATCSSVTSHCSPPFPARLFRQRHHQLRLHRRRLPPWTPGRSAGRSGPSTMAEVDHLTYCWSRPRPCLPRAMVATPWSCWKH